VAGNVVVGKDGWLFPAWDEIRRVDLAKTRRVAQVITNAVQTMKLAGIEVAISLTPTKARVYPEFLPDGFRSSPEADRRYAVALEELRKFGTVVPDLATLFATLRRSQPAEKVYFKADIHWTPMGAEPAAAETAKAVKASLRLPPSPRPGTRLGPVVTMRYEKNDLAEQLPAAEQRNYAFESFRVRQVVRGGQAALVEEDSADVTVVGNSFMQVGYGFPPMLSNQLERPVNLAVKIGRVGPYRTLLDYVSGQSFRTDRPKLIIWHFLEGNMEIMPDHVGTWAAGAISPQAFMAELSNRVAR
jgi:alginate O-acetyltransferase complex protein AlgJ